MTKLTRGERFTAARMDYNQHGSQSMDAVSKATGICSSMISDLENDDKNRSVGHDKILTLAQHYGVSVDYLLCLSQCPKISCDIDYICEHTGLSRDSVQLLMKLKKQSSSSEAVSDLEVLDAILANDANTLLLHNIGLLFCLDSRRIVSLSESDSFSRSTGELSMIITQEDLRNIILGRITRSLQSLKKYLKIKVNNRLTNESE